MKRTRFEHSLTSGKALIGMCGAAVALALAIGAGAVDAQQKAGKESGAGARPAPADVAQAAPAVPRREAKAERRETKRATRHALRLGVQLQAQGDQGLLVSSLEENGIAARAGLQQNDRIITVDGRAFASGLQLDAYLAGQGGRRVPMIVDRNGQRLTIFVNPATLAEDTAWLGVYFEEAESGSPGARILHVYPAGPAARAGLQAGDSITQIDDRKIENASDVITFVQEAEPQVETKFSILRNDKPVTLPVTLGSRREHFPSAANNGYGPNGQPGNGTPAYGQDSGENDAFEDVPPHAMHLEHDRRIAEQHQRIEQELQALREEIRQLREELRKK